ncbi:MAG: UvrD-helicase domain-containing protein [Muribaculaceae bacterium]|nr:UvrD-helicase domain-containing protein [Muribaculaceae bacterium]
MLKIQRASAGSGKTYTLARDFILHLLTFRRDDGTYTLRNARQIEDALTHILAITFTNKATAEMKERILSNLRSLAEDPQSPLIPFYLSILDHNQKEETQPKDKNQSKGKVKKISDVTENSTISSIQEAASTALRIILNNYSSFKISTIDSFFQEILRTFSYEANITENYKLEIDSSFIADAALDEAFHQLDTRPATMGNASFWLNILMREEAKISQRWNPFIPSSSPYSLYQRIRSAIFQLDTEPFKQLLSNTPKVTDDLKSLYLSLRQSALAERQSQLEEIKRAADNVRNVIASSASESQIHSNFLKQLNRFPSLSIHDLFTWKYDSYIEKGVLLAKYNYPEHPVNEAVRKLYSLIPEWNNPSADSAYKNWQVFSPLLPLYGLILEIRSFISDILQSNNLIRLSDTSFILSKIIGDEDSPFVYERMGNRFDHYLLDEFQDTSRMQWQIIRPLLAEGLAKGKDSLIIGDPKQSIYRFRNADQSLITTVVPTDFPTHLEAGYSQEENSNWRSDENIVRFNNEAFSAFAEYATALSAEKGSSTDFTVLYSNVVQYPTKRNGLGSIHLYPPLSESEKVKESDDSVTLPDLLKSILEKGYSLRDIAILVSKNLDANQILSILGDYKELPVISDESLLISSSPAVASILASIAAIGSSPMNDFGLKPQENNQKDPNSSESEESEPLPSSLVEIVETFISSLPENLRESQAPFLAAFQDTVLEYTANHLDHPAAFLEWWNKRGKDLAITSPDNVDAIRLMTIHKSKGLEFPVVIIPFLSGTLLPKSPKQEWRWVNSSLTPLPLPVQTTSTLIGSHYEYLYREYIDQVITDSLNRYYVGFTRAKSELHIFMPLESPLAQLLPIPSDPS